MPYRKGSTPERLFLPTTATEWREESDGTRTPIAGEYWVDMKRKAQRGDRLAVQEAMIQVENVDVRSLTPKEIRRLERDPDDSDSTRGVITDYEIKASLDVMMLRLIEGWNLDRSLLDPNDESGEIIPVTVEALDALDSEDDLYLQRAARKRIQVRKPNPPSNGQSPVSSMDTPSATRLPNAH